MTITAATPATRKCASASPAAARCASRLFQSALWSVYFSRSFSRRLISTAAERVKTLI